MTALFFIYEVVSYLPTFTVTSISEDFFKPQASTTVTFILADAVSAKFFGVTTT